MASPTGHPLLMGRFYAEYDIPVSLLWLFIILAGVGNWVVIWCILKTKALRNPVNMMVVALAFPNGVDTTIVGPMELVRILMLYRPVSVHWCNTRVLLKTFSFSISILVIFTLSAMRLTAGLRSTHKKVTYKQIAATIVTIYAVAAATSPILLDKTSSTYRVCLGNVHDERLRLILENKDPVSSELTTEAVNNSTGGEVQNMTEFMHGYSQSTTIPGNHQSLKTNTETATVVTTSDVFNVPSAQDDVFNITSAQDDVFNITSAQDDLFNITSAQDEDRRKASSPMRLWKYYLFVSMTLFTGTIICYIGLITILKKNKHGINGMVLGNSKDILTMHVTVYVTSSFFVSFLVPFFPALVALPPQATPANLHYISIFHCLSSLDGALAPLMYHFSNAGYRKSLLKALPRWMTLVLCHKTQVVPFVPPPPEPPMDLAAIPSSSNRFSPSAACRPYPGISAKPPC